MAKTRALIDVAKDPLAKKETVIPKEDATPHSIVHYALAITIGLVAGIVGALLSNRLLKII